MARSEILLAWMAGIFEGEGSIRIDKPTRRNMGSLVIDLPNTDKEITDPFFTEWGGHYRKVEACGRKRAYWRWRIASRNAFAFLLELYPYFRTERVRRRAELGISFQRQKQMHGGRVPAGYLERQVEYYEKMKVLNRRGYQARIQTRSLMP